MPQEGAGFIRTASTEARRGVGTGQTGLGEGGGEDSGEDPFMGSPRIVSVAMASWSCLLGRGSHTTCLLSRKIRNRWRQLSARDGSMDPGVEAEG